MNGSRMVPGTSLFSLTPQWRSGADLPGLLARLADADCGPALEVIGPQTWRGYPHLTPEDERAFGASVERFGFTPTALGIYVDRFRRADRELTLDEAVASVRPQLALAARLGFPIVRLPLGLPADLLRRIAAEAHRAGLVLTVEVQGTNRPQDAGVLDVLSLREEFGDHVGLTLDVSLTTPALPVAFGIALRRLDLAEDAVTAIHRHWADDPVGAEGAGGALGARLGPALALVQGHPAQAQLTTLIAGVFLRTGRQRVEDWVPLLPAVRHAHGKYWDVDLAGLREPYGAWFTALDAAGYTGAVVSEWGGHELLDRADVDALELTAAHVALLRELTTPAATAATSVTSRAAVTR